MKKEIRVYLQYPWKVSDSQYYKSLVDYPPGGIEYLKSDVKKGMIINKKKILLTNFLKESVREIFKKTNFPIVNQRLTKIEQDFDIIHCAHCLSGNKDKPWVADFESVWQMWILGSGTKKKYGGLRLLQRENCKKILAWTEETKKEIITNFPGIKSKVEVVSFAMPSKKYQRIKSKKTTLMFVSRYFYQKGGVHALEVLDRITKKNKDVSAIFISPTPEKFKEKYKSNKKISFYDLMPHEELEKIFCQADIMIYPGYSDTFGFLFVEAMAFGIPVITVDGFARKEMVEDGKTGFIIKRSEELKKVMSEVKPFFQFVGRDSPEEKIKNVQEEIIKKMVIRTEELIQDKKLREKMSREGVKIVDNGKFSLKERNKKLRKIYEESLNN